LSLCSILPGKWKGDRRHLDPISMKFYRSHSTNSSPWPNLISLILPSKHKLRTSTQPNHTPKRVFKFVQRCSIFHLCFQICTKVLHFPPLFWYLFLTSCSFLPSQVLNDLHERGHGLSLQFPLAYLIYQLTLNHLILP
jgi:hypothetical protein